MNNLSITQTALLTAFITITGSLKIPSIFPGSEFQLSAPIAVAICYAFGAKAYITAGILSSLIGLVLGTQNIFNVIIAMLFRLALPLTFFILGRNKLSIILAGPLSSTFSRAILGIWFEPAAYALILAAIPGMIFTAIASIPLSLLMYKVKNSTLRESSNNAI